MSKNIFIFNNVGLVASIFKIQYHTSAIQTIWHLSNVSFSYEDLGAAKSPLPEFVILQGFGFYFNPGLAELDIP